MSEIASSGPAVHLLRERAVYEERDATLDRTLWGRPVDPDLDAELIQNWMHRAHVVEFWQMEWPIDWIRDDLRRHYEDPTRTAYVGFIDDEPVGYMEVYDPSSDVLGSVVPVLPGDVGAHVLIGNEDQLGRISIAMGMACTRFLFRRADTLRIVGEPDVRNHNFLSLLAFLGYRKECEVEMPDKRAAFMVCRRADFERLTARRRVTTIR